MANVHSNYDLKQMQSLPLSAKIIMSQRRIREWYEQWDGAVYISFSGGKDSTVLKHLIEHTPGVYDVPSVFVDTGLEYPELRKFAIEHADVVVRPEMRFDEVIKTYGYPVITKRVADCVEGARRNPNSTRMRCLQGNELEYAPVYGEILQDKKYRYYTTGCDRTGCMFCMFGCHMEKSPNRFQRMKETHPRQYDYCMRPIEEKGLGLAEVLDYIGVDYK